jgi:hypothetical protein
VVRVLFEQMSYSYVVEESYVLNVDADDDNNHNVITLRVSQGLNDVADAIALSLPRREQHVEVSQTPFPCPKSWPRPCSDPKRRCHAIPVSTVIVYYRHIFSASLSPSVLVVRCDQGDLDVLRHVAHA